MSHRCGGAASPTGNPTAQPERLQEFDRRGSRDSCRRSGHGNVKARIPASSSTLSSTRTCQIEWPSAESTKWTRKSRNPGLASPSLRGCRPLATGASGHAYQAKGATSVNTSARRFAKVEQGSSLAVSVPSIGPFAVENERQRNRQNQARREATMYLPCRGNTYQPRAKR